MSDGTSIGSADNEQKNGKFLGKLFHKGQNDSTDDEGQEAQKNRNSVDDVDKSFARKQKESEKDLSGNQEEDNDDDGPMNYKLSYTVGVSENKNSKYRSTMEDVHTYVANFVERLDWGYFAIFDGHAGKSCAKWCGQNLHLLLEKDLLNNEQKRINERQTQDQNSTDNKQTTSNYTENETDIRDSLDKCFQQADQLIIQSPNNIGSSGCTAAVAIIRWELDEEFQDEVHSATANNYKSKDFLPNDRNSPEKVESLGSLRAEADGISNDPQTGAGSNLNNTSSKSRTSINRKSYINNNLEEMHNLFDFVPSKHHKRMLYTANVGDSRLVLCRSGYAIRLSYDHKGSDINESNRITQSGGLIMKNRVNGVLAITRSLGDSYLKNLIIGRPYTTAIEINEHDEFLILACDGLWDIVSDQEAVDLIRDEPDPNVQSKILVDHAMKNMSTDNITVMVIRFDRRIFGSSEVSG